MFEVWLQMSDTNFDRKNPSDLPALAHITTNEPERTIPSLHSSGPTSWYIVYRYWRYLLFCDRGCQHRCLQISILPF